MCKKCITNPEVKFDLSDFCIHPDAFVSQEVQSSNEQGLIYGKQATHFYCPIEEKEFLIKR